MPWYPGKQLCGSAALYLSAMWVLQVDLLWSIPSFSMAGPGVTCSRIVLLDTQAAAGWSRVLIQVSCVARCHATASRVCLHLLFVTVASVAPCSLPLAPILHATPLLFTPCPLLSLSSSCLVTWPRFLLIPCIMFSSVSTPYRCPPFPPPASHLFFPSSLLCFPLSSSFVFTAYCSNGVV